MTEPGDICWAYLDGYPWWPVYVCDPKKLRKNLYNLGDKHKHILEKAKRFSEYRIVYYLASYNFSLLNVKKKLVRSWDGKDHPKFLKGHPKITDKSDMDSLKAAIEEAKDLLKADKASRLPLYLIESDLDPNLTPPPPKEESEEGDEDEIEDEDEDDDNNEEKEEEENENEDNEKNSDKEKNQNKSEKEDNVDPSENDEDDSESEKKKKKKKKSVKKPKTLKSEKKKKGKDKEKEKIKKKKKVVKKKSSNELKDDNMNKNESEKESSTTSQDKMEIEKTIKSNESIQTEKEDKDDDEEDLIPRCRMEIVNLLKVSKLSDLSTRIVFEHLQTTFKQDLSVYKKKIRALVREELLRIHTQTNHETTETNSNSNELQTNEKLKDLHSNQNEMEIKPTKEKANKIKMETKKEINQDKNEKNEHESIKKRKTDEYSNKIPLKKRLKQEKEDEEREKLKKEKKKKEKKEYTEEDVIKELEKFQTILKNQMKLNSTEKIISALKILYKLPLTLDLLSKFKIPSIIKELRNHKDKKISKCARNLRNHLRNKFSSTESNSSSPKVDTSSSSQSILCQEKLNQCGEYKKKLDSIETSPQQLVQILNQIDELSLSVDEIKASELAFRILNLRKHSNTKVSEKATELRGKWKKLYANTSSPVNTKKRKASISLNNKEESNNPKISKSIEKKEDCIKIEKKEEFEKVNENHNDTTTKTKEIEKEIKKEKEDNENIKKENESISSNPLMNLQDESIKQEKIEEKEIKKENENEKNESTESKEGEDIKKTNRNSIPLKKRLKASAEVQIKQEKLEKQENENDEKKGSTSDNNIVKEEIKETSSIETNSNEEEIRKRLLDYRKQLKDPESGDHIGILEKLSEANYPIKLLSESKIGKVISRLSKGSDKVALEAKNFIKLTKERTIES